MYNYCDFYSVVFGSPIGYTSIFIASIFITKKISIHNISTDSSTQRYNLVLNSCKSCYTPYNF
jgi:hypothetical protein